MVMDTPLPNDDKNNVAPGDTSNPMISVGSTAKEAELHGITSAETPMITEIGKETDLSPELSAAGVKLHSTHVSQLNPVAQNVGVKVVGTVAVNPPVQTVVLPLTGDQIAKGLGASITSSLRWLAVWCVRRLKQLHSALGGNHA
jgi:hypothetical protein